tara:strand:- start:74 stop:331 length:258 start_codon:yes stop_codon:yes gene_type:complete
MANQKPKGMMRGGKMTSKMSTKGGAMGGKKSRKVPPGMQIGGEAKKTKMKKTPKGYAKGGVTTTKNAAKGGVRKPSSKNSGLYGR